MTQLSRKEKKAKVDQATIDQAWEHFRNYLDDDSVDELQELLSLIPPPRRSPQQEQQQQQAAGGETKSTLMQSQQDLLPLLLSTASMGIAEEAMSEYFAVAAAAAASAADHHGTPGNNNNVVASSSSSSSVDSTTTAQLLSELRAVICRYVAQSLEYYPDNAITYSLAANFARTYGCCSFSRTSTSDTGVGGGTSTANDPTARWYLKAATSSHELRRMAIQAMEDTENPASDDLKEWLEVLVLNHVCGVDRTCTTAAAAANGSADDDDVQDEEKEQDEATFSWSASSVEGTSRFMAAMLLSTSNRHDEAAQQLQYFPDISHRIHPNVWRGSSTGSADADTTTTPTTSSSSSNVAAAVAVELFKSPVFYAAPVLPPALYAKLCQVFDKDASYWIESDYEARGYYSYFADLPSDVQNFKPTNAIEDAVVHHLLPRVQAQLDDGGGASSRATTIVGYEWWVHTRPVGASLGHNLHFDTDESKLETAADGSISHPLVSSVLYLTAPPVSGATLVFQQTPDATDNAPLAWYSRPVDNSLMVFPGNLLHGVLPCRAAGMFETTNAAAEADDIGDDETLQKSLLEACSKPPPADSAKHRLSFMVGFWTRCVPDEMKDRRLYGPCGTLPSPNEADWVKDLQVGYGSNNSNKTKGDAVASQAVVDEFAAPTPLPFVTPGWEAINDKNASSAIKPDDTVPGLDVPRAIDHRFFVADAPRYFRESLFEPEDDDDDACIMAIDEDDDVSDEEH